MVTTRYGGNSAPFNDEYLNKLYSANYSDVKVDQLTKGRVPTGTTINPSGSFHLKDGRDALAVTVSTVWKHGAIHRIYFSQAAFSSKELLASTIAHEIGHVVLGNSRLLSEAIISSGRFDSEAHRAIYKMQNELQNLNKWGNILNFKPIEFRYMDLVEDAFFSPLKFLIRPIKIH